MSCLFNSYDPYFKQPFGALRAGQTVRLTLCIPEELGYVDPHLVLQKEGKYDVPVHYRMKFDGQPPQQNHFSVELPLNDPGLYFYYFDLYTDFRRIYRGPDNCGVVSWQEGEKCHQCSLSLQELHHFVYFLFLYFEVFLNPAYFAQTSHIVTGHSACGVAERGSQYTGGRVQTEFHQCYQHQFGTERYDTPCK